MPSQPDAYREIQHLIRDRFSNQYKNDQEKMQGEIQKFILDVHDKQTVQAMLTDAARLIYRLFSFSEVMIGLRGRDGLYRTEVVLGHTKEAEQALRSFAYSKEEMGDCEDYPGVPVSKYTEFSLTEAKPYKEGEEKCYNRPKAIAGGRDSPMTMLEGDYIDVYIYGSKQEMLGWIELSNPRDGKVPSRETVRWLELLAAVVGLAIERKGFA